MMMLRPCPSTRGASALLGGLLLALSAACAAAGAEDARLPAAGPGSIDKLFRIADEEPRTSTAEGNAGARPRYSLFVTNSFLLIDGEVRSDVDQVRGTGTKIDLHRDLGFDGMWVNFDLRLEARLTRHDLAFFRYGLMLARGENVSNGRLHFDHCTFEAGSKLESRFLLRRVGIGYERGLWMKNGRQFWLGLSVDDVHVRHRIIDRTDNQSDVEDLSSSVDLHFRARFVQELNERANFNVGFNRSIPMNLGNITHNNLHFDAGLEWRVATNVSCYAGYAFDRVDIEDREEDAPGLNFYRLHGNGLIFGVRLDF